jgi:hypothetical protein
VVEIEIGTKFIIGGVSHTVRAKCKHPNYKGWYSCLSREDSGTPKLNNFRRSEIQENIMPSAEPLTPEDKEHLQASINKMQQVSNAFYAGAIHTENHAFIEFCGLMGEYIKICQATLESGIDFTKANIHCGQSLVFYGYNEIYLREKLECIYGTSLANKIIPGSDRTQRE